MHNFDRVLIIDLAEQFNAAERFLCRTSMLRALS